MPDFQTRVEQTAERHAQLAQRVLVVVAIGASVLHAVFFALARPGATASVVGVAVAVATLIVAWRVRGQDRSIASALLFVAMATQCIALVVALQGSAEPFQYGFLQIAILALAGATCLGLLALAVLRRSALSVALVALSCALGLVIAEVVMRIPRASSDVEARGALRYVGGPAEHPQLGTVYPPHSVSRTYYPANGRGYFREAAPRELAWVLSVDSSHSAGLEFPPGRPGSLRVAIRRASAEAPVWGIQVSQPRLALRAGTQYALTFDVRADRPRRITVAVTQAHPPWQRIGLYEQIEVGTGWTTISRQFASDSNDANSQISFSVGADSASVEVSDVVLRDLGTGTDIAPALPPERWYVEYRFNAHGCRGRDYAIPKPPGTKRILMLGDSYTLGVGVHEEDTFSRQLELLLSGADSARRGPVEVINCGNSGYATRQERLFYELVGQKYDPDVVLIVPSWNDDLSFSEEVRRGFIDRSRGPFESMSYVWAALQEYRHRRPPADFSASAAELRMLADSLRGQNRPFGVVLWRVGPAGAWEEFVPRIIAALSGSGVPILDLERSFFDGHTYKDLIVDPLDDHLNEIAHSIAARELRDFLARERLLAR